MQRYFITGIGTEVGKTVASAIVTQALEADYWKPIQAGDLHFSDTDKVKALVSNPKTQYHPNSFMLKTPMSPHAAAEIDGVNIQAELICTPKSTNTKIVVEGAGGLLVPINDTETILDLIQPTDKIILVSRHYLGSINHTLMSVEILKSKGFQNIGILFNGEENKTTEEIITKKTQASFLGRIEELPSISSEEISKQAKRLKKSLLSF